MRNVLYRVDDRVVLEVAHLRGALQPTRSDAPPWFDDPASFVLAIDTGDVAITPASLTALLNDYVFNYKGSPLKHLEVSIDDGELRQRGVLHKVVDLPFTIRAQVNTTDDGRLRLHPTSVKVMGLPVKSLMRLFGIELDNLVHVRQGRGVEIEENDFLLAPAGLLPPPRIRGRLTGVRIEPTRIWQIFGGSTRAAARVTLRPSGPKARNYMFYRGRMLRFGKLTMADADLQIVDADPRDPFDFYLSHLNEQLVAGESRNQPDFGLLTSLPDYADLRRGAAGRRYGGGSPRVATRRTGSYALPGHSTPERAMRVLVPALLPFADLALLLLRLVVAVVFLYSGLSHVRDPVGRGKSIGMSPGFTRVLGLTEIAGALGVALGVLIQPAALGLIFVMLGAIQKKLFVWRTGFWGEGSSGWHYDLLFVVANLVIATTGGGRYVLLG